MASIAQRTATNKLKNFVQASLRKMPLRARLGLLALVPILVLPVLIVFLPPDGLERARPAQFLGRFHPLTVHLPIALVLLVPLLELAGRSRRFPDLRASVDFVLALATVSSIGAAILGWCLARSGGYSGRLVTQHMWGGVLVAAACWLCWMWRERLSGSRYDFAYTLGLVGAVTGGFLFRQFGPFRYEAHGFIVSMFVAVLGAVIVLLIWNAITGRSSLR